MCALICVCVYRNGAEWRSDRLLLNREVMLSSAVHRFLPLLDEVAQDFTRLLLCKVQAEGQMESDTHSLTFGPSPELFRFALEGQCLCWACLNLQLMLLEIAPLQLHTECTFTLFHIRELRK